LFSFAVAVISVGKGGRDVLVELGLVEQRYRAVSEVLDDGATVTDVARRYGVARQTVHVWLRRYAQSGLAGLADQSSRPATCPHQMPARVEARIVGLRREHPTWGPRTIGHQLAREGLAPVPGRSSIYRCLVRHGLIDPKRRRRRRSDYRRWERSAAMQLWQMDVMGRVRLADGSELSVVTGIDDHSRFCVSAKLVARATARPVCEALTDAMRRHGVPEQILTDNGKVFTGRFGPGAGQVLFDRICTDNGIRHLLTAPHSPTTTGKVERFHKTIRAEFLTDRVFASLEAAQAALDAWVEHYNTVRPHQGIGMVPPIQRFTLATSDRVEPAADDRDSDTPVQQPAVQTLPRVTRRVTSNGRISLDGHRYHVGRWLAGELVEVVVRDGLVEMSHDGVLIATHAHRRPPHKEPTVQRREPRARAARPATSGPTVVRKVDSSGSVSFAGTSYRVGNAYKRRQVQVSVVGDSVQIAVDGRIVRTHRAVHDRAKEHGAFATPSGRPRRINTA
jgi:transposase InsO family protein